MASFWDLLPARGSGYPAAKRAADTIWSMIPPELRPKVEAAGNFFQMLAPGSGAAQASLDAPQVAQDVRSGNYGQAAIGAGSGILGTLADFIPGGKLAMAAAPMAARFAADLPMDYASRMARADAMGMRRDMPVYHGTGETFDSFRAVPTNAGGLETPGVSTALDPTVANEFAVLRSAAAGERANPQVHKLWHRAERPAALTLTGNESRAQVVETLRSAFDNGYDAVMLKNYTTPGGQTKQNIIIVRDASQLRSPNAAFDPARKGEANLLASMTGAAIVPLAAFTALSEADQ